MKTAFKKQLFILLLVCSCNYSVKAQEDPAPGFKIYMDLVANDKGEVIVDMKVKYNAHYWDIYKRTSANNPSIIKNGLIKAFVKYNLTNFDVRNEEMERTYHATFTILGLLKLDENGKWIAELDTKDPDITKISETQFVLVDEDYAKSYKVTLPASATNSKIEKDAFGKAFLTYYAPVSSSGGNILKYGGILLVATGIFLFFRNRYSKKKLIS
jgi:hypothetical protein